MVLRQIAAQTSSYSLQAGSVNTTAPPIPEPPPFQPTSGAIRVNVLWFASLVLSLITASLGMLVKQWLREYLATENPSPQARLRIRHQRHPALKTWHVLEIGASLPFLLQLALAFFFVGVCYFTSEIHASIGHTTLPLVIAWAICFATATALPIIFPRCPYKTTLLTAIVHSLHDWITSGFTSAAHIILPSSPETVYDKPPWNIR